MNYHIPGGRKWWFQEISRRIAQVGNAQRACGCASGCACERASGRASETTLHKSMRKWAQVDAQADEHVYPHVHIHFSPVRPLARSHVHPLAHMSAHTFILGCQYFGKVCSFSVYEFLDLDKIWSMQEPLRCVFQIQYAASCYIVGSRYVKKTSSFACKKTFHSMLTLF